MKKLVYLLIAVSLMLALVPAAALAHTEDEPFVTDLIAGGGSEASAIDVGEVKVWNDADYLYVKYEITEPGWCLTKTHLHIFLNNVEFTDVPHKNGNPIPGHFDYKEEHDCVTAYEYPPIPLVWDTGTELYIAAHAEVVKTTTMWVYSDGDEGFTAYTGPGTASYPCEQGDPRSGTAVPAWQHSAWGSVTSQFTHGTWIWEAYRAVDPICGTVVDFEETFDIPGDISDGTLWVTADNGYEAYLNTGFLGSDGLSGDWRNSDLTESYVTTAQAAWSSVESYDLSAFLTSGANTFRFETGNEYFYPGDPGNGSPGTVDNNPGGLIYEAEISYCEKETAWGDGTGFPGKNWAMYFTYTVQCPYEPGLLNGGFEDPEVTHEKGWNIFTSAEVDWTVEWAGDYTGAPEDAYLELHRDVNDWTPYDGQYAELDTDWQGPGSAGGEEASVRIYQDLETCPGQEYTLSFAYSPRPGEADNVLEVYWGDDLFTYSADGSGNSDTDWTEVSLDVTASGWTTRLEFVEEGTPDSFGMFLDAVSVQKK